MVVVATVAEARGAGTEAADTVVGAKAEGVNAVAATVVAAMVVATMMAGTHLRPRLRRSRRSRALTLPPLLPLPLPLTRCAPRRARLAPRRETPWRRWQASPCRLRCRLHCRLKGLRR